MGIDKLKNKGYAFLNSEKIISQKRQIVVVGSARGGTSLVAGALHHLGIFTGDKSHAPVFEDVLLSDAFENNDLGKARDIVDRYSKNHTVWAWKRPAALNYLDKIENIIPNPFYIFIFKDIFAIANRNTISMQADIGKSLNNALADYTKIVDFVSNTDKPVMLVSAEKALQNKDSFVNALIDSNKDFKDCSINKNQAIDFITPNPKHYLDITRNNKSQGSVDLISEIEIRGWARYIHTSKPANVGVYVNGDLIKSIEATERRADLIKLNISNEGNHGFTINLESGLIKGGDLVEVKVKDDIDLIRNGSKQF